MENNAHRFRVTAQPEHVEEFDRVVSRDAKRDPHAALRVPLTFPATWYGLSEVQARIMETVGGAMGSATFVLLHLEQTIEMHGQLDVAETYALNVEVGALRDDKTLKVSAAVCTLQDVHLASMTSVFAVVPSEEALP